MFNDQQLARAISYDREGQCSVPAVSLVPTVNVACELLDRYVLGYFLGAFKVTWYSQLCTRNVLAFCFIRCIFGELLFPAFCSRNTIRVCIFSFMKLLLLRHCSSFQSSMYWLLLHTEWDTVGRGLLLSQEPEPAQWHGDSSEVRGISTTWVLTHGRVNSRWTESVERHGETWMVEVSDETVGREMSVGWMRKCTAEPRWMRVYYYYHPSSKELGRR